MAYGKYTTGTESKTSALHFETSAPLDDRTVVLNKGSLISQSAWVSKDYIFVGMMTVTQDEGKLYILKDKTNLTLKSDSEIDSLNTANQLDAEIAKSWVLVGSDISAVETLINDKVKTLFQFKGVATAIDPDHTTLTVGSGTVGVPIQTSGSIGIPTIQSRTLISYGTVLQENLDNVKYAWGTSEYPNLFFTDALYTTENIDQTQYKKGDTTTLQYINVFDTLYFYKGDQSVNMETGTRTYKVWEALDNGGTLYSLTRADGTIDVYTVTSTSKLPIALISGITPDEYTYYTFIPLEGAEKYIVSITSDISTIDANSENNGHVYQLGEEEYASNGNMWVQLGSPKTDWIVL